APLTRAWVAARKVIAAPRVTSPPRPRAARRRAAPWERAPPAAPPARRRQRTPRRPRPPRSSRNANDGLLGRCRHERPEGVDAPVGYGNGQRTLGPMGAIVVRRPVIAARSWRVRSPRAVAHPGLPLSTAPIPKAMV